MKKQIATVISNVVNPFLVGLGVILLTSFASAATSRDALKWALVAVLLTVLPIFMVVLYFFRTGRLDTFFVNIREQRTTLYLITSLCVVAGCVLLAYLDAPITLVAALVTSIVITLIFMCINFWWKISLHTAIIAGSATVLVILYGWNGWSGMFTVTLVPLTTWARVELKSHSFAQATTGAFLAAVIVVAVFQRFAVAA
ncbi:MAG: hypothetical protein Q7J73_02170 [Dehalococcoidales bacterium]|nr:hypothetical protein [Dehalococcoidales bacterium]